VSCVFDSWQWSQSSVVWAVRVRCHQSVSGIAAVCGARRRHVWWSKLPRSSYLPTVLRPTRSVHSVFRNDWASVLMCDYHIPFLPPIKVITSFPSPLLDDIRVMVIVWRLRGHIIRTALCWIVWHSVHSQQHIHLSSSYMSNRLDLSHWDPYAMCRFGCTWWNGSDEMLAWSQRPTGFLECLTLGLVIWPVKIVPEMTYNVLSRMLNTNQPNS